MTRRAPVGRFPNTPIRVSGHKPSAPDGATGSLFYLRRLSGEFLYWHSYKTIAARDKWLAIYVSRGDKVWANRDGSARGLTFLLPEAAVTARSARTESATRPPEGLS